MRTINRGTVAHVRKYRWDSAESFSCLTRCILDQLSIFDTPLFLAYNSPMKLATFNIHGWRTAGPDPEQIQPNLDLVTATLRAIDADIIGLNEVYHPRVVQGDERPALEALADRLQMHYVFGPCLRWPAQDNMPADAYGNAVLSRWPITASAAHHLVARNEKEAPALEGKEQRGLLEARVRLPDARNFTVYSTHLDHKSEEARLVQLRALRSWTVRDRNRPHVVMGDFNAISEWDYAARPEAQATAAEHPKGQQHFPPRAVAQMERAGYVDALTLFGQPGQGSFILADYPLRIDYIFVSQPLADAVRSCRIWEEVKGEEASDHRPVVAEIDDEALRKDQTLDNHLL